MAKKSKAGSMPESVELDEVPELDDDFFANADWYEGDKLIRRGRPPMKPEERKQAVKLRLSPEVVKHFRSLGRGWQTAIDETLKRAVKRARG